MCRNDGLPCQSARAVTWRQRGSVAGDAGWIERGGGASGLPFPDFQDGAIIAAP